MDMSIDKLRKLCIKQPYTHGLGMIRVILPKYTLNFHSDLIPADAKYLHSHQRNFTSECLFGQVKNMDHLLQNPIKVFKVLEYEHMAHKYDFSSLKKKHVFS